MSLFHVKTSSLTLEEQHAQRRELTNSHLIHHSIAPEERERPTDATTYRQRTQLVAIKIQSLQLVHLADGGRQTDKHVVVELRSME
jgi:hypothetical protein